MSIRSARKSLSFERQLHSVPLRNKEAKAVPCEGGLEVEVTLTYNGWLHPLANLMKLRRRRRYVLDPVGCEVYHQIDGTRTVENLIDWFADEHRLTFFEARAFLSQYLQTLMKSGMIAMGVPLETHSVDTGARDS